MLCSSTIKSIAGRCLTIAIIAGLGSILFAVSSPSYGESPPKEAQYQEFNYPGGIAELRIKKLSNTLPDIKYGLKEPVIIEHDDYWRVLIGLKQDTVPGEYVVYIKHDIEGLSAFHQTFQVTQKNTVMSGADSNEHLHKQYETLSSLSFNNTQSPSLPLQYPVEGEWNRHFNQPLANTKTRSKKGHQLLRQNLIAFSSPRLLTVQAPSNAIIAHIETDKTTQTATLFLDHGRGLYSVIDGLSDLTVEAGNGVVAGAVIGKLKPSGVNTSILTWQCVLNGVFVNPDILTQL